MSIIDYFFCVLMYLLGQALYLFLFTVPSLKEKCRIANKPFSWGDWWTCDWNIIVANFILAAMLTIGLKEFITWKPGVMDYIKWFFGGAGMLGTSLVQEKFGQFRKSINTLLDVKSNISDAITGTATTVKEAVELGKEATATDVSPTPKKP